MKKLLALLLTIAVAVVLVPVAPGAAAATKYFAVETVNGSANYPTILAGDNWSVGQLAFKNVSGETVTLHSIEMLATGNLASFPFDPTMQSYLEQNTNTLAPNELGYYGFNGVTALRVRGDAAQEFYDIPVEIRFELPPSAGSAPVELAEQVTFRVLITKQASAGSGSTFIPKVIVSGFSTDPAQVIAGESFTLSVTFKNTSSSASVANLKASLSSDGTFNAVSGSLTMFVSALAPGESKTASINLSAKADAAPGSYNVSLSLNYDAPNTKENQPVTETEQIAIPVEQVPKAKFQPIQINPSEIYTGQDFNLMTALNNIGKSKLYNVSVSVSDDNKLVTAQDSYIGNVDSGGTGNIDLYITPVAAGASTLTVLVTYEDEKGKIYTHSETSELTVLDRQEMIDEPIYIPDDEMPAESGKAPWWLFVAGALVLAVIVTLIVVRKKKRAAALERDRADARRLERQLYEEDLRRSSGGVYRANSGYTPNGVSAGSEQFKRRMKVKRR